MQLCSLFITDLVTDLRSYCEREQGHEGQCQFSANRRTSQATDHERARDAYQLATGKAKSALWRGSGSDFATDVLDILLNVPIIGAKSELQRFVDEFNRKSPKPIVDPELEVNTYKVFIRETAIQLYARQLDITSVHLSEPKAQEVARRVYRAAEFLWQAHRKFFNGDKE